MNIVRKSENNLFKLFKIKEKEPKPQSFRKSGEGLKKIFDHIPAMNTKIGDLFKQKKTRG